MRSNMNFKGYEDTANNGSNKPPPANNPSLMSQSSIYSLTFDEFQSTIGGLGKDFGSMNMDELLKNIWTAEETQSLAMSSSNNPNTMINSSSNNNGNSSSNNYYYSNPNGNLQRQGSLTLPRTLSQKTVDEVWRDLMKESGGSGGGGGANNGTKDNIGGAMASASAVPQRQQTLGEMTLEEFLVRAGVVREDNNNQNQNNSNNNSNVALQIGRSAQWFNDNNNTGLMLGFQQQQANANFGNSNPMVNSNNPVSKQNPPLSLQVSSGITNHTQPPLFPKPANVAFAAAAAAAAAAAGAAPMHLMSNSHQLGVQGGGGLAMAGTSPTNHISPAAAEGVVRSKGEGLLNSPVPYVINRPRKCSAIEKVVERRQRRMIKNRESAARSRARKQAYTLELEAEVQKLKLLNHELKRKQAKIMEMQNDNNQALVTLSGAWGGKRQCLRRTLTGPW